MKEAFKESIGVEGIEEIENELIIKNNHEKFYKEYKEKSSKKKCINKLLNIPFSLYFYILVVLFAIFLLIYYLNFYSTEKENFKIFERDWICPPLNDRKYENYLFNNGLEVMLIQDPYFDRDGGAIVIEKGYLDNPLEEGISVFATYLLSHMAFNNSPDNIEILEDYFGKFKYGDEGHFINFRFDILNDGFKKFIRRFSSILNFEAIKNLKDYNEFKDKITNEIEVNYEENKNYIDYKENHLIEYFVYGFKNESGGEILPEGNFKKMENISLDEISNYIENLINPTKIKIVIFSKYKFSILSKYMKYYFKYLTNAEIISNDKTQNDNKEKMSQNEQNNFNTSQLFYIKANNYESNYIKIIYYINKVGNESFSELNYKQYYFNYISDFISKTKNGSLYSKIRNKVRTIQSSVDIVLKSKIQFSIIINLISLKNINDVIYETFRYIQKITNETNKKIIQMDRYEELKDIFKNDMALTEKTFDTIELAKTNAEGLISNKYAEKYFFYDRCVPWNDDINNNNETIPNESAPYFRQLTPNNSIIILAIRDKDKDQMTCNKKSKFYLNCDYLKNESNLINTSYYDTSYIPIAFNSSNLTKYLNEEESNDFNICYEKNPFKSNYKEPLNENERFEGNLITLNNSITLNKFYLKNNSNFRIQRVLIEFNLYHPFLRPNTTNTTDNKCYYFLILEMFSAIKRKVNEELSDAILAKNDIYFGQNENNLYIFVYCFSDMAYNISKIIYNIINATDWKNGTDFISNNEIYKNLTFDDFLIYDKNDIQEISRFYFKSNLKNNVFNKYEFFPNEFEDKYYNQCIHNIKPDELYLLTSFIVQGYIYGYCEKDDEKRIFDLFNYKNNNICQALLNKVDINIIASDFINWMKNISNLKNNENITINEKIYNRQKGQNIGFTYRIFEKNIDDPDNLDLDISILQQIVDGSKIINREKLISNQMFYYNDFFFELIFSSDNKNETIPNNYLIGEELRKLIDDCKQFDNKVDNIGNRFYYMKKNFVLSINKTQTSLFEKGNEEIEGNEYKGTILNNEEIIKKYNKKYKESKSDEDNPLDIFIRILEKLKNSIGINIFYK